MEKIGVVVIGRNEGARLGACLASVSSQAGRIVYVDSGSTDDSLGIAASHQANIVSLDDSRPFTAARARNEGFSRLLKLSPDCVGVQFVDGDCRVSDGWLSAAVRVLAARPEVAVVCGNCREQFPDRSVYNMLCDMDWNGPAGDTTWCGGNALMRVAALREAKGFNAALIAGEELELCVRLRQLGYKIHRLDAEMVRHDAAMTRFSQWWKRTRRTGHAYAEGALLFRKSDERFCAKESRSAIFWGMLLPLLFCFCLLLGFWAGPLAVAGGCIPFIYLVQLARIYRSRRVLGDDARASATYASFCILGKLPQGLGVCLFHFNRTLGKRTSLLEYKTARRAE